MKMPAGLRIGAGDAAFGAYGMPYWNARQGGYAMGGLGDAGLGDCVTDPDTGQTTCIDTGLVPVATAPGPSAGPGNWINAIQLGVQDAFNFARLFNPVPPGTVMQTGPGGYSYVARAAPGQILPSVGLPGGFGSSGLIWILLIGGAAVLLLGRGK